MVVSAVLGLDDADLVGCVGHHTEKLEWRFDDFVPVWRSGWDVHRVVVGEHAVGAYQANEAYFHRFCPNCGWVLKD